MGRRGREARERRRCGAGKGLVDQPHLDEELGDLAFRGDQVQVAIDHLHGTAKRGGQRRRIGHDFGQVRLIAKFEPEEIDQRQADRSLEFVGSVEHKLAIGRNDDARDGLTDRLGQFVPAFADREPRGHNFRIDRRSSGDGGVGRGGCHRRST